MMLYYVKRTAEVIYHTDRENLYMKVWIENKAWETKEKRK